MKKRDEKFAEITGRLESEHSTNVPKTQRRAGTCLISASEFWDFKVNPEFVGTPTENLIFNPSEKDALGNPRLMGFEFVDEHGEVWIVGASHSIVKALEQTITVNGIESTVLKAGKSLSITWLGKVILKKSGSGFNKYEIILLD